MACLTRTGVPAASSSPPATTAAAGIGWSARPRGSRSATSDVDRLERPHQVLTYQVSGTNATASAGADRPARDVREAGTPLRALARVVGAGGRGLRALAGRARSSASPPSLRPARDAQGPKTWTWPRTTAMPAGPPSPSGSPVAGRVDPPRADGPCPRASPSSAGRRSRGSSPLRPSRRWVWRRREPDVRSAAELNRRRSCSRCPRMPGGAWDGKRHPHTP